jgi:hypothetical protein
VAGLVRGFKTYDNASGTSYSATGRGASVNVNLEPLSGLHLIGTTFFSNGGGRYVFGLGPDFIVNADGSPTLVRANSAIGGAEFQANPRTLLFGYYGTANYGRQIAVDATGKPIGYGVPGSAAANHTIDETTVGINQTFFREPRLGALQLIVQYSYLTRTPWSVAAGTPTSAATNMVYMNVRYVLP